MQQTPEETAPKNEHASGGRLALFRNHHSPNMKMLRNFGVSLPHRIENTLFLCHPRMP